MCRELRCNPLALSRRSKDTSTDSLEIPPKLLHTEHYGPFLRPLSRKIHSFYFKCWDFLLKHSLRIKLLSYGAIPDDGYMDGSVWMDGWTDGASEITLLRFILTYLKEWPFKAYGASLNRRDGAAGGTLTLLTPSGRRCWIFMAAFVTASSVRWDTKGGRSWIRGMPTWLRALLDGNLGEFLEEGWSSPRAPALCWRSVLFQHRQVGRCRGSKSN